MDMSSMKEQERARAHLSFAPKSVVYHDFDDGLIGFVKRFKRYGKGNRILAEMYSLNIKPKRFKPRKMSFGNSVLAYVQYLSMLWGWYFDLQHFEGVRIWHGPYSKGKKEGELQRTSPFSSGSNLESWVC